jgi:NADPH:quinone reductase-like Zn-dependent oxidoreductase
VSKATLETLQPLIFAPKENWPKKLAELLKSQHQSHIDAVIDSAGGDIMGQASKFLKLGGRVVCYGM